ncbi:MAG TPA: hypothetical protein VI704_07195, partial [Bacteroidota bacterium]|nr:hypothetical protein [Bacteroidota bacterium]
MNLAFIAFRNLVYGSLFFLLWGWIALGLRGYDERIGIHLPPSAQAFGITIMALGLIIVLACLSAFVLVGKGTPAPFDP